MPRVAHEGHRTPTTRCLSTHSNHALPLRPPAATTRLCSPPAEGPRTLCLPSQASADSFGSIGKPPTVQGCLSDLTADKWRAVFEEYFPPGKEKREAQDLTMVEAEQVREKSVTWHMYMYMYIHVRVQVDTWHTTRGTRHVAHGMNMNMTRCTCHSAHATLHMPRGALLCLSDACHLTLTRS